MGEIRKENIEVKRKWYNKPFASITGAIGSIVAIFVIGFGVGSYKENISCQIEVLRLTQEHNEKIEEKAEIIRQLKIDKYRISAEDIERVVTELERRINEK